MPLPVPENEVYALSRASRCHGCDVKLEPGAIVQLSYKDDEKEAFCQKCAGLADFVLVPSGNAKVTRLAKKYAARFFVVKRWSELWKCYERQGLLTPAEALERARQEASGGK